jgi:hypothetical protein
MSIEVKLRRGTSTDHASFTGAVGEVTIDTTIQTLKVHDGTTVGGHRIAKYDEIAAVSANTLLFVDSNIVPNANSTYDLGTANLRWRDLYLGGTSIYLSNHVITAGSNTVTFEGASGEPVRLIADSLAIGDVAGGTATILKSVNGKIASVAANNENTTKATSFANVSITNLVLENVLGTPNGGTGLTSFTQNGVLFAANSSALAFATGAAGKVMQVGSNGTPEFNDLDGGNFI